MPPDPPTFVSSIYLQQSDFNLDPPLLKQREFSTMLFLPSLQFIHSPVGILQIILTDQLTLSV